MRSQSIQYTQFLLNSGYVPDNTECWKGDRFDNNAKPNRLSVSKGVYDFSYCEWDHCSTTGNGAGICCSITGSSLSVRDCHFYFCSASGDGGGCYVLSANTITFEKCSFLNGSALSTSLSNGGAGIYAKSVKVNIWVSNCFFFGGRVNDDGGGSIFTSCSSQESLLCDSCRFLCGHTLSTRTSGGGGIRYENITPTPKSSNCLFALNKAYQRAGGLDTTVGKTDCKNLILFCFFYKNDAPHGSDVCLYCKLGNPNSDPFVHSFTLGSTNAYVSFTQDWTVLSDYKNSWLPLTVIVEY